MLNDADLEVCLFHGAPNLKLCLHSRFNAATLCDFAGSCVINIDYRYKRGLQESHGYYVGNNM